MKDLMPDDLGHELLRITRADASMGRMTEPRPYAECDTSGLLLHPRFAVQQARTDGSIKVRAVDDMSWAKIEGPRCSKKARKVCSPMCVWFGQHRVACGLHRSTV